MLQFRNINEHILVLCLLSKSPTITQLIDRTAVANPK